MNGKEGHKLSPSLARDLAKTNHSKEEVSWEGAGASSGTGIRQVDESLMCSSVSDWMTLQTPREAGEGRNRAGSEGRGLGGGFEGGLKDPNVGGKAEATQSEGDGEKRWSLQV